MHSASVDNGGRREITRIKLLPRALSFAAIVAGKIALEIKRERSVDRSRNTRRRSRREGEVGYLCVKEERIRKRRAWWRERTRRLGATKPELARASEESSHPPTLIARAYINAIITCARAFAELRRLASPFISRPLNKKRRGC